MKVDNKNSQGFTVVEALVAALIFSVLGLGIVGLQKIVTQSQLESWKNYVSVDEANKNVNTLVRELRLMRNGENGAYPLEVAADQEIIFYSDIDYDQLAEKVNYFLDGSSFVKSVIEPSGNPTTYPSENAKTYTLTKNVKNESYPIFTYYNSSWPEDTLNNPLLPDSRLSNTSLIKIYLRLNAEDNPSTDYILDSYSKIRL
jgi:hypothetical protein